MAVLLRLRRALRALLKVVLLFMQKLGMEEWLELALHGEIRTFGSAPQPISRDTEMANLTAGLLDPNFHSDLGSTRLYAS